MDSMALLISLLLAVVAGVLAYLAATAKAEKRLAALRDELQQAAVHQARQHQQALDEARAAAQDALAAWQTRQAAEWEALEARQDEKVVEMQQRLSVLIEDQERGLAARLGEMEDQRAADFERLGAIVERKTTAAATPPPPPAEEETAKQSLEELLRQAVDNPKKAADTYRTWSKLADTLQKVKDAFNDTFDKGEDDGPARNL